MLNDFALDMCGALLARIGFLFYGEWQDGSDSQVKYTDVDYRVFTDAARYVANGTSPYHRATYRYTPLLAWMLLSNILVHPICGKVLFVIGDLISGYFIHEIVARRTSSKMKLRIARWTWLFNPLTITISTRGSAESLISTLVLGTIHLLEVGKIWTSGLVYGLAIHFKIYPIIYCLPFYFTLSNSRKNTNNVVDEVKRLLLPTRRRAKFALTTVVSLATTSAFCYGTYGDLFLREAYFYHVTRKDTRHNFSVYFYYLYLSRSNGALLLELLAFLPQIVLLTAAAVKFHSRRHLHVGLFLQTMVFVTFNKVCTSQYFVWYLTLLPLMVVRLKSFRPLQHLFLIFLWLASQALWLLFAYLLEFQGSNTFYYVWLASLVFFSSNLYILASLIKQVV